jgi:hypothetical protein
MIDAAPYESTDKISLSSPKRKKGSSNSQDLAQRNPVLDLAASQARDGVLLAEAGSEPNASRHRVGECLKYSDQLKSQHTGLTRSGRDPPRSTRD